MPPRQPGTVLWRVTQPVRDNVRHQQSGLLQCSLPPPLVRLCAQPLMFLANALHLRCDVCEEPQLARDAIQ